LWGTVSSQGIFITWLDSQPSVATDKKIGTQGYCMGGPMAFRTSVAMPDRIGAVASFHGAGLGSGVGLTRCMCFC
jgi:dienelactone hydrolase